MTHASRTNQCEVNGTKAVENEKSSEAVDELETLRLVSGERVSNTWVICPKVGNNCSKGQLIPHVVRKEERDASLALG